MTTALPALVRSLLRPLRGLLLAALVLTGVPVVGLVVTATPASAYATDCASFPRVLKSGHTGNDVKELQLRVAGWAGYGVNLGIDGVFGAQTTTAVTNFQRAHGLAADGVAGAQTFAALDRLEDADCTTAHFTWAEVDDVCFGGFPTPANGVSVDTVRYNLRAVMWRAEALRQRLGNHPLRVTSAYRSRDCNTRVGGSTTSNHLTGKGLDLVPGNGSTTMCGIISAARYTAFGELLGPGYPDHDDHIHLGIQASRHWSAPRCGI